MSLLAQKVTIAQLADVYEMVLDIFEDRIFDAEGENSECQIFAGPLKTARDQLIVWASDVGMSRGWLESIRHTEIARRIFCILDTMKSRMAMEPTASTMDYLEREIGQLRSYVVTIRMRASVAGPGPDKAIHRTINQVYNRFMLQQKPSSPQAGGQSEMQFNVSQRRAQDTEPSIIVPQDYHPVGPGSLLIPNNPKSKTKPNTPSKKGMRYHHFTGGVVLTSMQFLTSIEGNPRPRPRPCPQMLSKPALHTKLLMTD